MSTIPEDYNKGGFYTFLGSMLFVVLFFLVIIYAFPPIDLGENIRAEGEPTTEAEPAATAGDDEAPSDAETTQPAADAAEEAVEEEGNE